MFRQGIMLYCTIQVGFLGQSLARFRKKARETNEKERIREGDTEKENKTEMDERERER